jgi:hypothetical protein
VLTIDSQLQIKIIYQNLFAFSYIDFRLVFQEFDIGMRNFEIFARLVNQAEEFLFNDTFGQLTVVFRFPMP